MTLANPLGPKGPKFHVFARFYQGLMMSQPKSVVQGTAAGYYLWFLGIEPWLGDLGPLSVSPGGQHVILRCHRIPWPNHAVAYGVLANSGSVIVMWKLSSIEKKSECI
jgi:hypothetical protein